MRCLALILTLTMLTACDLGMPDLHDRLSAEARGAEYPTLVPIGPLLAGAEAPMERVAAEEGTSLEARAAALRGRATWLRNLPL